MIKYEFRVDFFLIIILSFWPKQMGNYSYSPACLQIQLGKMQDETCLFSYIQIRKVQLHAL